jgi:hypothetical protein
VVQRAIQDAKGEMVHGVSLDLLSWKQRFQRRQHMCEEGEPQCAARQELASLLEFVPLCNSPVIALRYVRRHYQRYLVCHDYDLS